VLANVFTTHHDALRETSAKVFSADYIFVDVREYPEGCKLIGRYSTENDRIKLKLRKRCGESDETIDLEAGTVEELRNKIAAPNRVSPAFD
jgi:hypothetical protein